MNTEYHKWWSPNLGHDIELKVYGFYGQPVLVFPAQGGRFYDYENFGMIAAIQWFIDQGKIKLFTVDSIDNQSWGNWNAHPGERARRHEDYDRYITQEVVPFIRQHCNTADISSLTTGCSMGGFHSGNFFFRHPDLFNGMISLSGLFQPSIFVGDYNDEHVYFNSPLYFLPNLEDPWYLDKYRHSKIIICCGQGAWEEPMIADARAMKHVLEAKGIPCWIDLWGYDVNHDWPWWQRMMPYFLSKLFS